MLHFAALVIASSLVGDITQEEFKELGDRLVGNWLYEGRLPVDAENIGKAGDVLTDHRVVEWVANGTILLEKRTYRCNGKVVVEAVVVTAWERPSKQVRAAYFDSLGSSSRFSYRPDGAKWVLRYEGIFGNGLKNSGTSTMTFAEDGDTIAFHDTSIVFGDQQLPDQRGTFHRVK